MKPQPSSQTIEMFDAPSPSIARQTIRYVLGLTLACAVFVSLVSALSLFLAHRAFGSPSETAAPPPPPKAGQAI